MARASFEYDEVGNTFYYVLISFYALILLPSTYFLFPTAATETVKVDDKECQCEGCVGKRQRKAANKPWRRTLMIARVVGLVVAWVIFALIVKKVSEIEVTHVEYDPYAILQLDRGATKEEIKRAYHKLSRIHHPDRGGDPVYFDKIAKASQALTDAEARENWEKYGNPDGPTATTFGIALPKWLVSDEYGLWVLAFYGLIFMVILPVIVGIWWYNSIKYSVDKVLLDTTQLFYYFINRTPKMETNRMLMVLGGAFEFWKQYNKEVIERESDDVELPRLMKQLPNLGENKKERPLSLPYALKARILIFGHLSRIPLESDALTFDQQYILSKVIRLIEEMVNVSQQLTFYSPTKIPIDTMENLLRLQPMFVQALWPKCSPLLQLPHISEYNLQHLRKSRIHNCGELAAMDDEKRRAVLRSLSDQQYRDVLVVLTSMPRLSIETSVVVEGEDDAHEITAGCLATLKVTLKRVGLLDPEAAGIANHLVRRDEQDDSDSGDLSDKSDAEEQGDDGAEQAGTSTPAEQKPKRKVWEKQQPKKKGGKKGKATKSTKKPVIVASATSAVEEVKKEEEEVNEEEDQDNDDDKESESSFDGEDKPLNSEGGDHSEDDEWLETPKKKVNFDAKSHATHPVHCPLFSGEKFEWWWLVLTMVDKRDKQRRLASSIVSCKTLDDEQTVEMRLAAPDVKGHYHYQLSVRSDSYMDCDYVKDIKFEVKEAKQIVMPKYEDTEDEKEEADESSEGEYTEGSDSDDE